MLEKLMRKIDKNCNNVDKEFIEKAYNLANYAHEKQRRESGEPYIVHPIEVACILADLGMDDNTIAAGLLHDVIEDTDYSFEDIEREFNKEVAILVDGVTKLGKIKYKTKEEQQADNVRKMLLAMTKDIRVILIKLADRLHNMRTLRYMPVEKQKEKAKETFDIYAPLAHRLGMFKIKWELEDLAFRYINPNEYYDLVRRIAEKRIEREEYISTIISDLSNRLENASIESDIEGRPKHFYSIYRKMVNKNKTIDQIFDLTAIRILVDNIKDCYAVLGIVHTVYKPIPGRFKDYIAMPKPNMYQSLHTTVIGPQGKTFEIQIRTFEMHKTAEYGIAAHWKYKEGDKSQGEGGDSDSKFSWLRDMLEWQKETSDAEEFMEGFKIDLFSDEVFVFTPKGKVINLPYDSTPIDFAYRIHTDIGNKCIGSKVNGNMVPLDYKLKTGEIVEVLTSATPKGPSIDWLNIAKSNQAKSKIRAWFKKEKREENVSKGKEILEKESKKQGYNFGEIAKGEIFDKVLKKYNFNNIDDLFAAVGMGVVVPSTIVIKLKEGISSNNSSALESLQSKITEDNISYHDEKSRSDKGYGITVKGLTNVLVRFAKCCSPVPGDDIIGYITKGRGISVHRSDCKNIQGMDSDDDGKFIEVEWGNNRVDGYISDIQLKAEDRSGLLTDVMLLIVESKMNLHAINAKSIKGNIATIDIRLKIKDIEQLKEFMKRVKKIQGVIEVYRKKY
ncbi:RelA/SpoT family protein [Clostridium algidicarnis]|uniref:RelA/SpoT family protein n=1 Tax=Clostridium algidicarnis TaxID=37659 RepID=UPI001C0C7EDC|nr:bifunctional (p)ppGpp synthetase/guanosine-3',5'-bis(diphosphate) 3'-pyrophosphohydrolase [Clostridium algidicarnis]MBU3195740.1 bifunctional (p)ppGpp synthetase/guanosine-3',5'-bis(diphosphate) 3'-pyrophosphohydrolase [Clostridium algidicarnis]MBU3226727.1 bifunctional (p)ppGpp synthetase/guanosine-3',5'-bis(diphosphate) 3'-pyrophosphohydrolase [Clostridium algidicarnis]MBU3250362.1 bifunctional (p)ppGpp synthetase/guanosine-3',5'-bis(diphosphate) 3'-pyrophosphohydrolase [Clostridium algidic